jgi:hypothetical protein
MTRKEETELIYKEESYAIIGPCFEVYKDKGCGFSRTDLSRVPGARAGVSTNCISVEATANIAISRPHLGSDVQSRLHLLRRDDSRNQSRFCIVRRASRTSFELPQHDRLQIRPACKLWTLSKTRIRAPLVQKP